MKFTFENFLNVELLQKSFSENIFLYVQFQLLIYIRLYIYCRLWSSVLPDVIFIVDIWHFKCPSK